MPLVRPQSVRALYLHPWSDLSGCHVGVLADVLRSMPVRIPSWQAGRLRYNRSRSPLRSVAFGHHAPGTKKSCHPSLHSSIIFSPYSLRPKSFGPVLFVPKLNLQPAAFASFTNAALGSLYRSFNSIAP